MKPEDVGHLVAQTTHTAGTDILEELAKIGKTALSQILGTSENYDLKHDDIKKMASEDDKFSESAISEQQAKIKAAYEAYYEQKRRREKLKEEEEQKEEERKKMEEVNAERVVKQKMAIPLGVAKTRAEIKNYGAE